MPTTIPCYRFGLCHGALIAAFLLALVLAPVSVSANAASWVDYPPDGLHQSSGPLLLVRAPNATYADADQAGVDDDEAEPGAHEPAIVSAPQNYRWTPADVLYVRSQASPRARCIIDREVGGFGYDPWRRGAAGERGPVQLHPRGLLPEFLVWSGGQAPENPYWAVPFLEYKLRQGQGRHWSPVRLGLC